MSEAIQGNVVDVVTKAKSIETVKPVDAKAELAAIELELKKAELEEKRLGIELSKANLVDSQERLDERKLKRDTQFQRSRTNGETLKLTNAAIKSNQKRCNHKKGGNGQQDYVAGRGDDPQYCVFRHTFANGDTWVFCLRCHRQWKPPAKSDFTVDGVFDASGFAEAKAEYLRAMDFTTKNAPSSGVVFNFSDQGEYYREVTKNG